MGIFDLFGYFGVVDQCVPERGSGRYVTLLTYYPYEIQNKSAIIYQKGQ
jgi:hypothetical protein